MASVLSGIHHFHTHDQTELSCGILTQNRGQSKYPVSPDSRQKFNRRAAVLGRGMNPNFMSVVENVVESAAPSPGEVVGYRFHPRDDELVDYYLRRKILGEDIGDVSLDEVKIYCSDPWELLGRSNNQLDEWVFYCFCPRFYKYVNSKRCNRTTKNGYWKPTGKIREVKGKKTKKKIGTKKTLVFYKKDKEFPKGVITPYVMHEYEYMADPNSLDKEKFTLCKLKRKRDKRIPKNTNTTNHHASTICSEASHFGDQISPSPQGEGCYSIQEFTCESSEASHVPGSKFENQMSSMERGEWNAVLEQESHEYSEANCLKASDLASPVLLEEATNSYQVDNQAPWEYNKATCFTAFDLRSPVSPPSKDEGCLTPSTLESHSVWDNDRQGQVVDSTARIHQYSNIYIDASCQEVEPCFSGTRTPNFEFQKKQMEMPILSASEWNDLYNLLLFPEVDPASVDLIATS